MVSTIDVARGHLGRQRVAFSNVQRGAVIGQQGDALRRTGARAIEHRHLSTTGGAVGMCQRLSVHTYVPLRFFHQAVRLARHHVAVLRQSDAQSLTTPLQREQQGVGLIGRCSGDCHRPVERRNRFTECVAQCCALCEQSRHQRWNHLCIGGDGLRHTQLVSCTQVGMIVDVAIERGNEIRGVTRRLQLFTVHRMGIGLGDDADARPSRVAKYGNAGVGLAHQQSQEIVVHHGVAHHPCVVAQLANFGGRLVHERPRVTRDSNRSRGEQAVVVTVAQQRRHTNVVTAQTVVPHHDMNSGRVTAANLESVDCRQRLLNGKVRSQGRATRARPGHCINGQCSTNAILA